MQEASGLCLYQPNMFELESKMEVESNCEIRSCQRKEVNDIEQHHKCSPAMEPTGSVTWTGWD